MKATLGLHFILGCQSKQVPIFTNFCRREKKSHSIYPLLLYHALFCYAHKILLNYIKVCSCKVTKYGKVNNFASRSRPKCEKTKHHCVEKTSGDTIKASVPLIYAGSPTMQNIITIMKPCCLVNNIATKPGNFVCSSKNTHPCYKLFMRFLALVSSTGDRKRFQLQ